MDNILRLHKREAQTLRVKLRQLTKRVNLSTEEGLEKREDVTSSKECKEPYFLVQPRAKQKGALEVGDIVVI